VFHREAEKRGIREKQSTEDLPDVIAKKKKKRVARFPGETIVTLGPLEVLGGGDEVGGGKVGWWWGGCFKDDDEAESGRKFQEE